MHPTHTCTHTLSVFSVRIWFLFSRFVFALFGISLNSIPSHIKWAKIPHKWVCAYESESDAHKGKRVNGCKLDFGFVRSNAFTVLFYLFYSCFLSLSHTYWNAFTCNFRLAAQSAGNEEWAFFSSILFMPAHNRKKRTTQQLMDFYRHFKCFAFCEHEYEHQFSHSLIYIHYVLFLAANKARFFPFSWCSLCLKESIGNDVNMLAGVQKRDRKRKM